MYGLPLPPLGLVELRTSGLRGGNHTSQLTPTARDADRLQVLQVSDRLPLPRVVLAWPEVQPQRRVELQAEPVSAQRA